MCQRQGKHIKWNWILTPVSAIKVEWDLFLQLTASATKQFILGENYWQQIKRIQMSPCLSWVFFPTGVYGFHSFSLRCNFPSTTVKSCETQINKVAAKWNASPHKGGWWWLESDSIRHKCVFVKYYKNMERLNQHCSENERLQENGT